MVPEEHTEIMYGTLARLVDLSSSTAVERPVKEDSINRMVCYLLTKSIVMEIRLRNNVYRDSYSSRA